MKQAWLMGKGGPWEIREVDIPKPGPNQLLVRVTASSICNQTDLNTIRALHPPHDCQSKGMLPHHFRIWDNRVPDELSDIYPKAPFEHSPFPTTMGHEACGVVEEIGDYIKSDDMILGEPIDFKVGDRVVGIPVVGGFGEYILLDRGMTTLLPDNVSDEEGTLVEPVFMVYNVVRQVVEIADDVAILGQGALGLIATQIAKRMGAANIYVTDLEPKKRKLAIKYGADVAMDPREISVVDEILRLTRNKGVEVAIEAAGERDTTRVMPYIMALGGRIGQIGAYCEPVLIDWSYIHFRGVKVTSETHMLYHTLPLQVLQYSVKLISQGLIDLSDFVTHKYRLEQIDEAFEAVKTGKVIKAVFNFD
jgi:threonine dehydrogenase-like Zn-dependent dehydrogenase